MSCRKVNCAPEGKSNKGGRMPAISFDTLAYAKEVEGAGFTRQQAEAFALAQKRLFHEVMSTSELATKLDLNDVHTGLSTEIQDVRTELKTEIQNVRTELKTEIQEVRTELKTEIQNVRTELKTEIQEVRTELKTEIQDVRLETEKLRTDLKAEIQDVRLETEKLRTDLTEKMEANKHEILKWMLGTVVAQTALIVAVIGVAIALVVK